MQSNGLAGGGGRTSTPNGGSIACTLDSDCPLPDSFCNPVTGLLEYYVNPRCDEMLCSYQLAYVYCGGGTTTAGGLGVGGSLGIAGANAGGSGGQGADGGAGGESGADPGGAAGN